MKISGTIQTKKGRPNYYIVLYYLDQVTGKPKRPWIPTDIPIAGNNKRKANERLKEVITEYERQSPDLSQCVLFTVFLEQWLENTKHSLAGTTYATYKAIINNQIIPFFKSRKLKVRDINTADIQQYINYKLKSVSPNTVRKHLWIISKCLNNAIKQNLLVGNPVKCVDLPKQIKFSTQYYNEQQIDLLLETSKGHKLEAIILFALFYGLRRSEIVGLKWDAIDFDNDCFTIKHTVVQMHGNTYKSDSTKNKSSYRVLPLVPIVKNKLEEIKKQQMYYKSLQPNDYIEEGYIFTHEDGRLILPNYVTKTFKKILLNNDLSVIRFHDLRHSSASYLLHLGFSMKDIQSWLGHGDISTTMDIYAHHDLVAKKIIAENLNEKFMNFI